jgi:soluble lytic murein transglycosylase
VDANELADRIVNISSEAEMDMFLIAAVVKAESNFNPKAISAAGALGLMQILPSTARTITKEHVQRLFEPEHNLMVGTAYLKSLLSTFKNTEHALVAYNWGPVHLAQAINRKRAPLRDAKSYAKNIMRMASIWQNEFKRV